MTGPQLMDSGGEWMRTAILDLLRERYEDLRSANKVDSLTARTEIRYLARQIRALPQIHGARSPHLPPEPPATETSKDAE
jgi:hypothetical protein